MRFPLIDCKSCFSLPMDLQLFAMQTLPEGEYAGYLRKSRADLEAESKGGEDVYKTHERTLLDMAKRLGINLTKIYREKPISGEKILQRPEMIQLLDDVDDRRWKGILVVEVERLARGDTMDQGIVAQTFKFSQTLIITPMKIYDPTDAYDEEFFEYGLFQSRREFKTTTRRLQGGRLAAIKDGRYVGSRPPYGYQRVKLPGKGYTLEPNPEQAPIVKLIFSLYTDPDPEKWMGTGLIAKHLNDLKIPTARKSKMGWIVATINGILRNPVYIGNVFWGSRPEVKRRVGSSRPRKPRSEWDEHKGQHQAIIDLEEYDRAQEIMSGNSHPPTSRGKFSNPLAGLIRCDMCGGAIVLKGYKGKNPDSLLCITQGCRNVSSYFFMVEERLFQGLRDWLEQYKVQWKQNQPKASKDEVSKAKVAGDWLKQLQKKLNDLKEQKDEIYTLLEKKAYTLDEFLERSQLNAVKIEETNLLIVQAEKSIDTDQKRLTAKVDTIPKIEHVLKVYENTESIAEKNVLLKSILERVDYRKEVGGRWSGMIDKFTITLHPKLPKESTDH
jgi:site-specific DNA recombinase